MAPQIFQVLRCFQCLVFQTHQVKKSIKWNCKMCGEKQSRKRNYGVGSGKECRLHVQKLNGIRGGINESNKEVSEIDDDVEDDIEQKAIESTVKKSKWSKYVSVISDNHEDVVDEGPKVILEIPKKKFKAVGKNNEFYKKCVDVKSSNEEDSPSVLNEEPLKKKQKFVTPVKITSETDTCTEDNVLYLGFTDPEISYQKKEKSVEMFKNTLSCNTNKYSNNSSKNIDSVLSKSSKWTKFVDDAEDSLENEQNDSEKCGHVSSSPINNTKNIKTKENVHNLFSLCDDSDLDNVLSI